MPNYDFKCTGCGALFEKLVPMADRDLEVPCPDCGAPAVRKAVNGFASAVKGQKAPCGDTGGCGCSGQCPHSR